MANAYAQIMKTGALPDDDQASEKGYLLNGKSLTPPPQLSVDDQLDLVKQVLMNKQMSKQYPGLTQMTGTTPEKAFQGDPEKTRAGAYNTLFQAADQSAPNRDFMRSSPDTSLTQQRGLGLRKAAGDEAAKRLSNEVMTHGLTDKPGEADEVAGMYGLKPLPVSYENLGENTAAVYRPKTKSISLNKETVGIAPGKDILDSIIHEYAHANIDNNGEKLIEQPEGKQYTKGGTFEKSTNEDVSKQIKGGGALEYSQSFSEPHFSNRYAVPSIDMAVKQYLNKLQERGYSKLPPEMDPKFDKSQDQVGLLRRINAQDAPDVNSIQQNKVNLQKR